MTRPNRLSALILALSLLLPATAALACGPDTDCILGDRSYRIYLPEGHDGATSTGALIFAHGYKGSAQGTMRNRSLQRLADKLDIALVAANADGDDWLLPNAPSALVDSPDVALAYFDALRADILAQHSIDPDRIIVSGFSAGGMMTWTLACHRPTDYAGFIAVAGTFWHPSPDSCTMPAADIVHVHGTSDRIVPMEGRPIGDTRQGNVETVLAMYRKAGDHKQAPAPDLDAGLTCDAWTAPNGALLLKCLHGGAHRFRINYIEAAWTLILTD